MAGAEGLGVSGVLEMFSGLAEFLRVVAFAQVAWSAKVLRMLVLAELSGPVEVYRIGVLAGDAGLAGVLRIGALYGVAGPSQGIHIGVLVGPAVLFEVWEIGYFSGWGPEEVLRVLEKRFWGSVSENV